LFGQNDFLITGFGLVRKQTSF